MNEATLAFLKQYHALLVDNKIAAIKDHRQYEVVDLKTALDAVNDKIADLEHRIKVGEMALQIMEMGTTDQSDLQKMLAQSGGWIWR